jgi:hypothetical protein
MLVNVTDAPLITAPVGSVTVPLTVPRLVCAETASERPSIATMSIRALIFMWDSLLIENYLGDQSSPGFRAKWFADTDIGMSANVYALNIQKIFVVFAGTFGMN